VQGVIPQPEIASLLQQHFVALASDIDAPESELIDLAASNIPDAMMLPFVLVLDAEGRFLAGSSGAVHAQRFRQALEELIQRPA